jgi:Tol biopolymer transport system component
MLMFIAPVNPAHADGEAGLDLIAFTDVIHCPDADCDCPGNIVLAKPDGTLVREIETGCYDPSGLEWSADGEWLMQRAGDPSQVALTNAKTYGVRIIKLEESDLLDGNLVFARGTFSPDSSLIAYTAFVETDNPEEVRRDYLYVMDIKGSNQHLLVDDLTVSGQPVWSPDGTKVVFAGLPETEDQQRSDLYAIQRDGSGLQRLTDTRMQDNYPLWSPDGRWLIWSSMTFQSMIWNTFLMDVKSGESEFLMQEGDTGSPISDWSPDGRSLILSHRNEDGAAELNLLDMELRLPQSLVTASSFGGGVDWSLDGTRIVYARGSIHSLYADICIMEIASGIENCPGLKGHWLSEPMWR